LFPYLLFFTKTTGLIMKHHENPPDLKQAAKLNVQIHMLFSILFVTGLLITVLT